MQQGRVGLGIIGIGNIAPINARGYLDDDRCDVVALCDVREDKARRVALVAGKSQSTFQDDLEVEA